MTRMGIAVALWLAVVGGAANAITGEARADTDYRCLSDCLNSGAGTSGAQCLARCSYQNNSQPLQPKSEFQSAHSQFIAPAPTDEILVGPSHGPLPGPTGTPGASLAPTVQPLGPSTNYTCMRNCQAKGYQHALCISGCSY
jgi:hypothetical protein